MGKTLIQEIHSNQTILELKNLIKEKLDDLEDKDDYPIYVCKYHLVKLLKMIKH